MKAFFNPEPVIIAFNEAWETAGSSKGSIPGAIDEGADVIMITVGLTADGRLVSASDKLVPGFSRGSASRFSLDELRNNAQNGEGGILIPEFSSLLESFPEQRFLVNLVGNDPGIVPAFRDALITLHAQERILAGFMAGSLLNALRADLPEVATTFTWPGVIGFYALFRTGIIFFRRNFKADALVIPEKLGTSYMASQGLIRQAREKGLRVYILNVTNEKQIERLHNAGADGFIGEDVSLMKRTADRLV